MAQHPVDVHVGRRLKSKRIMLGMSQEDLGQETGVTFQQIQKYERGLNRIGSSRLYEFSRILDIPVSFFFEGLYDDEEKKAQVAKEEKQLFEHENLANKEVLGLIRAYNGIEDPQIRKKIYALTKSLSTVSAAEEEDVLA